MCKHKFLGVFNTLAADADSDVDKTTENMIKFILDADNDWQPVWKALVDYSSKIKYLTGSSVLDLKRWSMETGEFWKGDREEEKVTPLLARMAQFVARTL